MTALDLPAPGAARSLWLQEALAADPGEPCPPLRTEAAADVCIVGGGFCGLWTAIELSGREPGLRIALVERDIVGGGASGRNGGFFSSSWWDLPNLVGLFGERPALAYADALTDSVSDADAFVRENGIRCGFHLEGAVGVRTGDWQGGVMARDEAAELAARLGHADEMRPLTGDEARGYADSPRFLRGRFMPSNAICQPAALARGLRGVALARGARIFERTRVRGIERGVPAVVRVEGGALRADQVVLATGAWAGSWPGFRRSFAVIVDSVVATEPIPDRLEEIGWTRNVGIADGRDLLYYLRPTDDGRIVIGGGTLGVAFGARASSRSVTHDRARAEGTARGLLWLFPQLEGVRFTHAWGGPIDQTVAGVPFYRSLAPGNVHAGLGFSGHGLSQTFVGGKILASRVLRTRDRWTELAVNRSEIAKTPPEPLRWPAAKLAAVALERGEARLDAGRPRGAVWRAIGEGLDVYRERATRRRPDPAVAPSPDANDQ
jgi:glycine/D-amino acid oxidase-like deaminating enzyme